jgi:hypothetical protein
MDLRNIKSDEPTQSATLIPREVRLNVSYVSPDGARHDDVLLSRIPDGDGRTQIDRRSAILAGVPWQQLSEYAQARFLALATISVYLVDLPDWVNQWAQEDDELLFSLREEVERHALAWFRSGAGEGDGDEVAPRVRISTADAP